MPVLTLLSLVHLSVPTASAQDGFNAWGFAPSAQDGDVRDPVTVTRPGQVNLGEWYAAGTLGFAKAPLYRVTTDGGDSVTDRTAVLDNVLGLDITAGAAVYDRVRLDLSAPLFFVSGGDGGSGGPAMGDLRVSALVVPVGFGEDGGIGIRPWIALPTGASGRFLGSSKLRGGLSANATVTEGPWTVTGEVGMAFNGSIAAQNIDGADQLAFGAAVGRLVTDAVGVTLEGHLQVPLASNEVALRNTPGEALLSVRHRYESGAHALGGIGTSLTPGVGSAELRVFIGGGFGVLDRAPPDLDLDGILDADDACVDQPETVNGYRDTDGCPDELATLKVNVTHKGEPFTKPVSIEAIHDEAKHTSEASPLQVADLMPEASWTVRATAPCQEGEVVHKLVEGLNEVELPLGGGQTKVTFEVVDEVGDPIPNAELTFVEQRKGCEVDEPKHVLPEGTGSLDLWQTTHKVTAVAEEFGTDAREVVVTEEEQTVRIELARTRASLEEGEIRILEQVHFETDSASIKPISFQLLDEVAAIIIAHEEILLVEVQGHADERGSSDYNLKLSKARAKAVRQRLVDAGVAEDRLAIEGYGESQPIQPGTDEEALAANRRVQFLIRETANVEE